MSSPDWELVDRWADKISINLESLKRRILAAGPQTRVTPRLIAVSKGQPVEAVLAALSMGLIDLGENYAQELQAKAVAVEQARSSRSLPSPNWHFIGQLQSNKVRLVSPWVSLWQSVDRDRIAVEIAKHAPRASVLVQANLSNAMGRGGVAIGEVARLVNHCQRLDLGVEGLMAVASIGSDAEASDEFSRLRLLCDQLDLRICSMGMSDDLEIALARGSTMLRVGSALFGPRR